MTRGCPLAGARARRNNPRGIDLIDSAATSLRCDLLCGFGFTKKLYARAETHRDSFGVGGPNTVYADTRATHVGKFHAKLKLYSMLN